MRLIVGLGNPGPAYALTRHNIGWRIVEQAAVQWAVTLTTGGGARQGAGRISSIPVRLALPLTWMNLTGAAIKELLLDLGLGIGDLIVVHDDLDLEIGHLRIRQRGGAGGHNGVQSVVTALETDEFCRVKVGIGRPLAGHDVVEYVLSPFAPSESISLEPTMIQAVEALECLVVEGPEHAMNRYNQRKNES